MLTCVAGCSTSTAVHALGHFEQRYEIKLAPAEVREAPGRHRRVHGHRAPPHQYVRVNLVSPSISFFPCAYRSRLLLIPS